MGVSQPVPSGYVSLSQLAVLVGRSRLTVYRWHREGRLAGAVRDADGKRILVPATTATGMLENGKRPPVQMPEVRHG